MTHHDQEALATLPWDVVSSYLSLKEALSLRLASSQVAMFLSDSAGYEQCSTWLQTELMRRNAYVFNDVRNWMHARKGRDGEGDDSDDRGIDDNQCLLSWLARSSSPLSDAATSNSRCESRPPARLDSPFNLMLRCLRVLQHLPHQLTVAYSGKYGRHCWGLSPGGSSVVRHAECHRNAAGRRCATCRTHIETVTMATTKTQNVDSNLPLTIDQTLCIPVGAPTHNSKRSAGQSSENDNEVPKRRVRLDRYHNKCIPNVPSDLVCPCCLVADRRTMVLTEMSYRTEPGTERISPMSRSLTFTPAAALEDDARGGDKTKRRRLKEGGETGTESAPRDSSFPPMYREAFLYNHFDDTAMMDVKHAISLHCDGCGKFGVLSPAYLRAMEAAPHFGSGQDASTSSIMFSSAMLQRGTPHR